jgi:hypothetical protein
MQLGRSVAIFVPLADAQVKKPVGGLVDVAVVLPPGVAPAFEYGRRMVGAIAGMARKKAFRDSLTSPLWNRCVQLYHFGYMFLFCYFARPAVPGPCPSIRVQGVAGFIAVLVDVGRHLAALKGPAELLAQKRAGGVAGHVGVQTSSTSAFDHIGVLVHQGIGTW